MNARRTPSRGFTLVELMVSLVAGLIVTVAVVGLARTATTTFYEQARLSTTEAAVRLGAERLRNDLARTSYMSTGNIKLARNDSTSVPFGQKIAHVPGGETYRYTALKDLQGIKITVGGSATKAPISVANGLNPDSIELTGNFTTDDSYRGKINGTTITLTAASDVAVARLVAGPDANVAAQNAFTPGPTGTGAPKFMARVTDARGCHHFVLIASITGTSTGATITLASPTDGTNPVLTPAEDQSTCGAAPQEEVTVSPLQTVRWYLDTTKDSLKPDTSVEAQDHKYDLYREMLDGTGATIGAPGGPQVVAEYAVDLKFGITVDAAGVRTSFDMDTDDGKTGIGKWTQAASATTSGGEGPQRVRAVRFRLATRAALADRKQNMTLISAQPQFLSRYCTTADKDTKDCKSWARVRTIMSEVTLMNQVGMSY